jgi:hypothetical protein
MAQQHQVRAAVPCVAHRLSTVAEAQRSQAKPARRRRSAISCWQPRVVGVTDARGISSLVEVQTSLMRRTSLMADAETLLEAVVAEALRHVPSSVTTTGRRISCGYSFSSSFHSAIRPGVLAMSARGAPGRRGFVDHRVPAAELVLPFHQRLRRLRWSR